MPMEIFDAPPSDVKPASEPSAKAAPKAGGDLSWTDIIGRNLVRAAKETATLPLRAGRLAVGLDDPKNLEDTVLLGLSVAPLIAAGGAGAGALAGRSALRAVAPALGRIATSGAVEGGRALVGGEHDPTAMTALGAFGGALGEVGAAGVGRLAERFARPVKERIGAMAARGAAEISEAAGEATRSAEGARVGKDIGGVLPEFETTDARELYGVAKDWGKRQLDRVFEPSLAEIRQRIGGGRAAWLNVPALSEKRLSFTDALEGMNGAKGAERFQARQQIIAELNRLDPQHIAGQVFDEAMKARAAGRTYLTIVGKSLDASGRFDPAKAATFVNRERDKLERFAGHYWPQIEQAVLGGAAPVDVAARKIPSVVKPSVPDPAGPFATFASRAAPFIRGSSSAAQGILSQPGPAATGAVLAVETMPEVVHRALRHIPGVGRVLEAAEGEGE